MNDVIKKLSETDVNTLTDTDLSSMGDEVETEIERIRLDIKAKRDKFFNLCMILKKHGVGYLDFQKEAYALKKEFEALSKELKQLQTNYTQLRRTWERLNGKNQVSIWGITERGTMTLIR